MSMSSGGATVYVRDVVLAVLVVLVASLFYVITSDEFVANRARLQAEVPVMLQAMRSGWNQSVAKTTAASGDQAYWLADHVRAFADWMATHDVSYSTAGELVHRFESFSTNLRRVHAHNEQYARGEVPHELSTTVHADRTDDEVNAMLKRPAGSAVHAADFVSLPCTRVHTPTRPSGLKDIESEINWIDKGYIFDVPPQTVATYCNYNSQASIIAALGALEGQINYKSPLVARDGHAASGHLKQTERVSLSSQQIIDCLGTSNVKIDGCNGTVLPTDVFNYVAANGIATMDTYPSDSSKGPCRYDNATMAFPFVWDPSPTIITFGQWEIQATVNDIVGVAVIMNDDASLYSPPSEPISPYTRKCANIPSSNKFTFGALVAGFNLTRPDFSNFYFYVRGPDASFGTNAVLGMNFTDVSTNPAFSPTVIGYCGVSYYGAYLNGIYKK